MPQLPSFFPTCVWYSIFISIVSSCMSSGKGAALAERTSELLLLHCFPFVGVWHGHGSPRGASRRSSKSDDATCGGKSRFCNHMTWRESPYFSQLERLTLVAIRNCMLPSVRVVRVARRMHMASDPNIWGSPPTAAAWEEMKLKAVRSKLPRFLPISPGPPPLSPSTSVHVRSFLASLGQ